MLLFLTRIFDILSVNWVNMIFYKLGSNGFIFSQGIFAKVQDGTCSKMNLMVCRTS